MEWKFEADFCETHFEIFTQFEVFTIVAISKHLIWLSDSALNITCKFMFSISISFIHCWIIYLLLNLPCYPCFSETKAERLASSWGFYSRAVGTHYHGFLQNLWNQAYEVHFLDAMKYEKGCMEDYNLTYKFMSLYLFKNTLLLC